MHNCVLCLLLCKRAIGFFYDEYLSVTKIIFPLNNRISFPSNKALFESQSFGTSILRLRNLVTGRFLAINSNGKVVTQVICFAIKTKVMALEIICKLRTLSIIHHFPPFSMITAAGLAQSVERLTAEWEVADSIPGAGPILRV